MSKPLSPNAFVQIPAEVYPPKSEVFMPASRQKKMRVPHGGSVERPMQRNPRRVADSVRFEEPSSGPLSPSLHVILDPDPEEDSSSAEEQPESLAQFVASFPKIPHGLIFQTPSKQAGELDEAEDALVDDLLRDEGSLTIKLGEGELPPVETASHPLPEHKQANEHAQAKGIYAGRGSSPDRVMAAMNPRFEKMIRDVDAQRASAQVPMRPAHEEGMASASGPLQPRMKSMLHRPTAVPGSAAFSGAPHAIQQSSAPIPTGPRSGALSPVPGHAPNLLPSQSSARLGYANPAQHAPLDRKRMSMPEPQGAVGHPRNVGNLSGSTFAPAVAAPIPAGQSGPHPLSTPSQGSTLGKPILDPHAIEESTIFDEPPIPISEGMKDADKNHSKGRKFVIIGIVAVVLIVVAGVFLLFSNKGNVTIPEISITTTNPNGSGSDAGNAADANNAETDQQAAESGNGAGAVTYKYTAKTPSGIEYTVEESTTFDAQGNCTFTTMRMQFPSESAAKDFTDSLARDLGSKYTLDSLDGANATVTVDNSALGLNREDYENALRYSVNDLVILKK